MYAKNNPAPKPITIGTVTKISDGVVQTTGVSVKISKDGAAYGTGGGSLSIEEGEWSYLPTQGETDCESLRIVLFKNEEIVEPRCENGEKKARTPHTCCKPT